MGHKYVLNRSEKGQFCIEFLAPFCENKYICLQGWIEGAHLWDFKIYNCCFSGKDHAGIVLNIEMLGYIFHFEFCDLRHWNDTEQRFYMYDEPQTEWIRPDYPMEQYFKEIREFIADHPEIDKNYYRRCLITYKLRQQNELYGDDWNKRLRADKIGEIARSKAPKLKQ